MTARDILIWPNKELAKVSEQVSDFDEELKELASDMLETMTLARGIGIAAPQIGVHKRVVIVDLTEYDTSNEYPIVMVNPVLSDHEGTKVTEEACLSVPGVSAGVTRANKVTVNYQDVDGDTKTLQLTGMAAVCAQHECDHLDGILFVDKLSKLKQGFFKKKIKKLQRSSMFIQDNRILMSELVKVAENTALEA